MADQAAGNVRFPWQESEDVDAAVEATGMAMPVAWLGRTSTDDQQDPTLSLPRQLNSARSALPANCTIVAHFYDVESGRMAIEDRGRGHAHEAFDIPIARDGGIQDLLAEAKRPDRRFLAVVCESVERVARRTYFGTKIEYELEQAGVMLLAADEPIPDFGKPSTGRARKRATPTLTRRVKQAVAEWYVLQMLELSWDAFCEHTEQGWNVGKPCYGYRAKKVPHPVAAKRAQGCTKSRLIPHPVEGPTVTKIFEIRAVLRLGYDAIADRLNADPERYPPPTPVDPRRALGRWSGSAIREILVNPKYTGYMVWNRRATKKGGRCNPPNEWVWSQQPVHEPLVTKVRFQEVTPIGKARQGSRSVARANHQPQTRRVYQLRSYVICELCDRRMHGKTRKQIMYHVCEPDRRHHRDRRQWYADHPMALWVREDDLMKVVEEVFADHILGPQRQAALRRALASSEPSPPAGHERLKNEIAELERRCDNLVTQIEDFRSTGDEEIDAELRERLRVRYAEAARQRRQKASELTSMDSGATANSQDDPALLAELPNVSVALWKLPDGLRRELFDSFNLQLRYRYLEHEVTVRITVKESAMPTIKALIERSTAPDDGEAPPDPVTPLPGALPGAPHTGEPPARPPARAVRVMADAGITSSATRA
ncbi:recombinase family protein [Actinomadura oligospora]|uniref:recombinase family protein n=1 Tax=Actinomadura oligospora TaxID=111804 RepID=UPI0004B70BF5|nr:recombinase family protein [Actinomadura oligospora]